MKTTFQSILLAVGLALSSFQAHAQCGKSAGPYHARQGCFHGTCPMCAGMVDDHGNYFLDFASELELTEAQTAKLNKLRTESSKDAAALSAKIKDAWQDLTKASHDEKTSKKDIEKLSKKLGELKGELIAKKTLGVLEAKKVLTEAQRKKMWDAHHKDVSMGEKSEKDAPSCH